jgi:hypothetical protein
MSRFLRGLIVASAGALAIGVTVSVPAAAEPDDYDIFLDAGQACADFGLGIDVTPGNRNIREFTDDNGNVVRILDTGRGNDLVFTNDDSGDTFTLKSNGAVNQTTFHGDGTRTVVSTGHNVVILFPTDIPAGPSTKLYVGRLVYESDASNNFVLTSFSGRTTDICAQLDS